MAREVIVQPGQCLEDIAIQAYGHVDGVTWLLLDNETRLPNGYSTDLPSGTRLALRDTLLEAPIYRALLRAGHVPATNTTVPGVPTPDLGDYNDDHNDDHWTGPDP